MAKAICAARRQLCPASRGALGPLCGPPEKSGEFADSSVQKQLPLRVPFPFPLPCPNCVFAELPYRAGQKVLRQRTRF